MKRDDINEFDPWATLEENEIVLFTHGQVWLAITSFTFSDPLFARPTAPDCISHALSPIAFLHTLGIETGCWYMVGYSWDFVVIVSTLVRILLGVFSSHRKPFLGANTH